MKCKPNDDGKPCERCRRSGAPCIFVPRANAAIPTLSPSLHESSQEFSADILERLERVEVFLGFRGAGIDADAITNSAISGVGPDNHRLDDTNAHLRTTINQLRAVAPHSVNTTIWQGSVVNGLWAR